MKQDLAGKGLLAVAQDRVGETVLDPAHAGDGAEPIRKAVEDLGRNLGSDRLVAGEDDRDSVRAAERLDERSRSSSSGFGSAVPVGKEPFEIEARAKVPMEPDDGRESREPERDQQPRAAGREPSQYGEPG